MRGFSVSKKLSGILLFCFCKRGPNFCIIEEICGWKLLFFISSIDLNMEVTLIKKKKWNYSILKCFRTNGVLHHFVTSFVQRVFLDQVLYEVSEKTRATSKGKSVFKIHCFFFEQIIVKIRNTLEYCMHNLHFQWIVKLIC